MYKATINSYNKFHQVYDSETIEFWDKFPKQIIKEFNKKLNGNRILDLGSGPGRDALLLKENKLDVICLDASVQMVEHTRKLGFESILGDMRKMAFPEKSFDGIWAYTSLLHIKELDMKQVLNNIRKILKPNGAFLIGMIEGDFEGEIEHGNIPGAKRYFRYYNEDELRKLIESQGFKFEYQEKYIPHNKVFLSQIYSVLR